MINKRLQENATATNKVEYSVIIIFKTNECRALNYESVILSNFAT